MSNACPNCASLERQCEHLRKRYHDRFLERRTVTAAKPSPRLTEHCAEVICALSGALAIACETGRTTGPEFDNVSELIRKRDEVILDESDLTPECIGQLIGGG